MPVIFCLCIPLFTADAPPSINFLLFVFLHVRINCPMGYVVNSRCFSKGDSLFYDRSCNHHLILCTAFRCSSRRSFFFNKRRTKNFHIDSYSVALIGLLSRPSPCPFNFRTVSNLRGAV